MLYAYVCESCQNHVDLLRSVSQRDARVWCECSSKRTFDGSQPENGDVRVNLPLEHDPLNLMRREVSTPTVHFKGAGWTRTPSIMKDPIASGHPQGRHNWGTDVARDMGDPNLLSPYKKVVNETVSADGEVD